MRVTHYVNLGVPPKRKDSFLEWAATLLLNLGQAFLEHARTLNGNLGFGDGTDIDNVRGKWITFTSSATPGAENTINHNLGSIPVGFLVMNPPQSGTVNRGSGTWTKTDLYLTCSAASQSVTIFVLVPSHTS